MSTRTQQEAVYAAERGALGGYGRRFQNVGEIRAYVDRLVDSDWFHDRWPDVGRVAVSRIRSSKWAGVASARSLSIAIAYGAAGEAVVLHELAHVVSPPDAGHGPVFCFAFLALVREHMGFYAWAELYHALESAGCLDGRLSRPREVER